MVEKTKSEEDGNDRQPTFTKLGSSELDPTFMQKALRNSLMLMANKDPEEYAALKDPLGIVQENSIESQNKNRVVGKSQPSTSKIKSLKGASEIKQAMFGLVKEDYLMMKQPTHWGQQFDGVQVRKHERDILLEKFSSSSDENGITTALRHVREIPLEDYLSQEKANKVRRQQTLMKKRPIKDKFVQKNRNFRGSDENGTRYAESRYNRSNWSQLDAYEKGRRLKYQYKNVSRFEILEGYENRKILAMKKKERQTIQDRVATKQYVASVNRMRRNAGQAVPIEDKVSNWTEQVPETDPLVSRDIQYMNRIPKLHLQSLDADQLPSYLNSDQVINNISLQPRQDQSVQMSGLMVQKGKKMQTLTQYELIPEVIYSAMDERLRQLASELLGPTMNKQKEMIIEHQTLYLKSHQMDARIRECQLALKKQLNMKSEFDNINIRLDHFDLKLKRQETETMNFCHSLENKVEKNMQQVRAVQSTLKAQEKFFAKKSDDSAKMQEIMSQFKDRLMEKYAVLADEYTDHFKNIASKHLSLTDQMTRLKAITDGMIEETSAIKVVQAQKIEQLEEVQNDTVKLAECYKYGPRLKKLEQSGKSDLIGVTRKLNEILYENKRNMKRTEALKLIYSMQIDMASNMMDPEKHKSGQKPTRKNPKLQPEVQSMINLLQWQMEFVKDQPFTEKNVTNVMNSYQNNVNTNVRAMRTKCLKIELDADKIGQKLERAESLPKYINKIINIPKVELPVPQIKQVKFVFKEEPTSVQLNKLYAQARLEAKNASNVVSSFSKRSQTLTKQPSKSNLRKINKILEPQKFRALTHLSTIKRSRSFVWEPRFKHTIHNLYYDPTAVRMMDRLRKNLTVGPSNIPSSQHLEPQPRARRTTMDRKPKEKTTIEKAPKQKKESLSPDRSPELPKEKKAKKQKTLRKSKTKTKDIEKKSTKSRTKDKTVVEEISEEQFQQITTSDPVEQQAIINIQQTSPPSSPKRQKKRKVSSPVEAQTPVQVRQNTISEQSSESSRAPSFINNTTQNLLIEASDRSELNQTGVRFVKDVSHESYSANSPISSRRRERQNIPSINIQKNKSNQSKKSNQKNSSSESDSDSASQLFSSEDESSEDDIASIYYDEFLPRLDFEEGLQVFRNKIKAEIMGEAKKMIEKEANELVETQVEMAQINMGQMLQDQLSISQESMKVHMGNEVVVVKNMIDKIEKNVLPENLKFIQGKLEDAIKNQRLELSTSLASTTESIKMFKEKVEFFETDVSSTQTKFKRLVSNQDIFKNKVDKIQKMTQEMVRVMRAEQLACGKVISTLVELEFIQQSLDFQDEFDKTQMNLYGLNDLNITMEQFLEKSSDIASKQIRHETMKKAHEQEKGGFGNTTSSGMGSNLDLLNEDSTFQAVKIDDNWPEFLTDDNLRKQIHSAFKLACVYYKPSPVLYRGNSYNRRSLIEAKRQMLDADWQLSMNFQPFKRMWGENSDVNFFDQFAQKLQFLIMKNEQKGNDIQKFSQDLGNETFVKIMEGTHIMDIKQEESYMESLLDGGYDDHRMLAALKDGQQLNISSSINMGIDATQSSIHQNNNGAASISQLQNSARANALAIEVISNKKTKRNSPEAAEDLVESRTRSLLNALVGKSIFGPTLEESIYSNTESRDQAKIKLSIKKPKNQGKQRQNRNQQTRSVQQKNDHQSHGTLIDGTINEFVHTPFLLNQSQVIQEQNNGNRIASPESDHGTLFGKVSRKTEMNLTNVSNKSLRKNLDLLKHPLQNVLQTQSPRDGVAKNHQKQFWSDNPMFEMRPLIGKEQLRSSNQIGNSKGTSSMTQEHAQNIGNRNTTQYSLSPWNRTGIKKTNNHHQQMRLRDSQNGGFENMSVIGKKEHVPKNDKNNSRNVSESFQHSQVVNQTDQLLQLNLPVNLGGNFSSPNNAHKLSQRNMQNLALNSMQNDGQGHSISQSVLTLPQVRNLGNNTNQVIVNMEREHLLKGSLGTDGMQKSSLAESRFINNISSMSKKTNDGQAGIWQQANIKTVTVGGTGLMMQSSGHDPASTTSLGASTNLQDDKLSAKLEAKTQRYGNVDSTSFNTQRLKDIARQKKQHQMQQVMRSEDENRGLVESATDGTLGDQMQ